MTLPTAYETLSRFDAMYLDVPSPLHQAMLRVWRDHYLGEIVGDVDLTMSTMPSNPRYRVYGSKAFGEVEVDTAEAARAMYQGMFDAGLVPGAALEDEHWSFGSWGVALEAVLTSVYPGAFLANHDASLDAESLYLVRFRSAQLYPFDTEKMLMLGEILYMDSPMTVEPTDASTIAALVGEPA